MIRVRRCPAPLVLLAVILAAAVSRNSVAAPHLELARADSLWWTGRYEEARVAYTRHARAAPLVAALGQARCQSATGKLDQALQILRAAAEQHAEAAAPRAEMALLEFERGEYGTARRHVESALSRDPDQCEARFVAAELHRVAGQLDEANDAYRWFVRFYNREQERIVDPEVLRWIGLAGAQYARWNRSSGQFHFLVNTLYPDARKLDPRYWRAHLEAALLFIEKYNRAEATAALDSALAINPNAAEAHAARALIALQQFELDSARAAIDRALAIHPRLVVAHQLRADVEMVATGPGAAVEFLERARTIHPVDEETLGRLAAVYGSIDGLRDDPAGTRMGGVINQVVERNPKCGVFFAALAASLDRLRKYPHAARFYEEARRRMPQLVAVPGQLGLVYMRLGDEARAAELLDEAFDIDPFNVRVKNTLEVLDLLQDYGTLETEHFVVKFDRGQDSLLARYAARYLEEEVYPEIVARLGFAPPRKSLFEIFAAAKGTSGHSWFSARMVGLPFIGTVGACAGQMVAIASPNDGRNKFNWARVLRHEFVHVVNLQQTRFNIPHWYTEALAVRYEGSGRPAHWDRVLARRAAAGRLFDLATINMGFQRPESADDWALAYCQAELYARYMADTYGEDALVRMLAAYADHLGTPAALQRCFGVSVETFERGYRRYVTAIVDTIGPEPATPKDELPRYLDTLQEAARQRPQDPDALARLARGYLERGLLAPARDWATAAREIDPKHPAACLVLARVLGSEGNRAQALEVLRQGFDPNAPSPESLTLLVNLTIDARDFSEAERLCRLGMERFPHAANWIQGLATVQRGAGQLEQLALTLDRMAARDADDAAIRTELARLAIEREDFAGAARWATEALHIDVMDGEAHALLARGLSWGEPSERAIEEYETAIRLAPERLEWRLALAETCAAARHHDRARQVLDELLERDPQYPRAQELRAQLGR